ncbi:MAG: type II toxin-antitoxin system prevent-host-death family antitoxin [Desulfobacteraceae bacterium]|jgi:prevent-host-death family protein
MHTVNMHEAKTRLSFLVKEALKGEDVIIANAGKPLVKLAPVQPSLEPRIPGRYKGLITMADDFDNTPDDLINAFEGDA